MTLTVTVGEQVVPAAIRRCSWPVVVSFAVSEQLLPYECRVRGV
ncbi:hypothetical protein [Streptomyces sp. MBT65]|nr:hypothetical protein [Streptomyces sp. MBT65]